MNVLHIVMTNKFSGAEKIALLICKNLDENFDSHIICGGKDLENYYKKNGINSHSIDFNKNILRITKQLHQYIKDNKITIVHSHDNKASIYAYLTKLIYNENIKLVSHIHSCYPWLRENSKYKKIDKLVRNRYDINLMCGAFVYDYYLDNSDYLDKSKAIAVSNFIDVENLIDQASKYKTDKNKKFTFGFVGRLSPEKGLNCLMNELAKHKDLFTDSKFVIVGSGEEEAVIKKIIDENKMGDLVELKGYQENVYKYYNTFDALFLSSKYEGLPMVILEAMALKIPVVSMDVGGISEVINDQNGVLVTAGNYKQFVLELLNLKNNTKNATEMGKRAFDNISLNYDASKEVKKIETIYERYKL